MLKYKTQQDFMLEFLNPSTSAYHFIPGLEPVPAVFGRKAGYVLSWSGLLSDPEEAH